MRNNTILPIAVMALALAGCNRGLLPEEDNNTITIKAVMAENNPTRTVIQEGTTSVLWEPADEVKVFYKTTGSRFTSNNTEPAGQADFTGNLTISGFFNEGFTADTPLWAVYPYRADATSDGESVTTTLPAAQTARAGSFAKRTFITLAKSANTTMGFYNVCGGIRFSLTQEGIKEVVFQGQNDEVLAGRVKLTFADGVPVVQEVTEGQKVLTLTAPNNGTFETGQWYYIVALPGTLSGGFKMTFNTDTEYATLKSNKSVTIKRGIFGSLADADEDLIFKEKGEEPPVTGNIVFADIAAKYACVAKYDTDGDGEVSVEEAEAATSFEGLFTNWKGVTSFEEIRYFKNVHSLSGVFTECDKLTSITVPESINSIGVYTFDGCSSLTSVTLPVGITDIGGFAFRGCTALGAIDIPSSVQTIGSEAFNYCSSLTSVIIPSSVNSIGYGAFSNCAALSSIDIPSTVTTIPMSTFYNCSSLGSIDLPASLITIGQYAFYGCRALTQMAVPNSVTSLGSYVFSGCSSLETVILPSGITSIPQYCFQNCTRLATITLPSALTTINSNAFAGCRFAENNYMLQLPSSVTSIGSNAFGNLHHLIMPSTTPISIESDSFNKKGYTLLYVPDDMVDMYKVRSNWINYAFVIRPISAYPAEGDHFNAIDMGLSVKWANCNIGAIHPEEYGDYFAWGEIDPQIQNYYVWDTYKWCNGSSNSLTKYNTNSSYGTVDNKISLDLEDDAARANWGGSWRMPTDAEWTELRENCTWTWTTRNGVNGRLVTSNTNGNSIFLPAAGTRNNGLLYSAGNMGTYWSSSLSIDGPFNADDVIINSDSVYKFGASRSVGLPVRPVTE